MNNFYQQFANVKRNTFMGFLFLILNHSEEAPIEYMGYQWDIKLSFVKKI